MDVLNVVNLKYFYNPEKIILNNISFSIKSGDILVILGPNGAGKSTLLKNLCHILVPREGFVSFNEKKNSFLFKKRSQLTIYGYIPQLQSFIPNIEAKEYAVLGRSAHIKLFQQPTETDYDLVKNIFKKLDIINLYNQNYATLSGGEQQQVLLAKILCQLPSVLLMDEPASQLDYGSQIRFLKIVKRLSQMGYIIILTSHNPNHALYLDCYAGIIDSLGNFKIGEARKLLDSRLLSELYKTPVSVEYNNTLHRLVCNAI